MIEVGHSEFPGEGRVLTLEFALRDIKTRSGARSIIPVRKVRSKELEGITLVEIFQGEPLAPDVHIEP